MKGMLVFGTLTPLMSNNLRLEVVIVHFFIQSDKHLRPNRFVHEDAKGNNRSIIQPSVGTQQRDDLAVIDPKNQIQTAIAVQIGRRDRLGIFRNDDSTLIGPNGLKRAITKPSEQNAQPASHSPGFRLRAEKILSEN